MDYNFTNSWFDQHKAVWSPLLSELRPARILEVGSYEGNSTTYLVESIASLRNVEIHCIDSWVGRDQAQGMWLRRSRHDGRADWIPMQCWACSIQGKP